MQRGWEVSGYHDDQDIGSRRGVVWFSLWGVRPKDKTGVPIGIVKQEFSPPRTQPRVPVDMFGVDVAGHQDRHPPPKQASRSAPIIGREGESYPARTFTGLPASTICMAVASSWARPGTGTEWWVIPRRTSMAVPPPAVGLSVRWQTVGKPEGLARVKKCTFNPIQSRPTYTCGQLTETIGTGEF